MNLSQDLEGEEKEANIEKEDILEDEEKNIPKKEGKEEEASPKKKASPKKEASRSRWLKYFGTSVAAAAIIAFLIVGIQKIAQPQPECYAVIDERFIPTRSSFITKPWMPWKMFRQIPRIHSVPWI